MIIQLAQSWYGLTSVSAHQQLLLNHLQLCKQGLAVRREPCLPDLIGYLVSHARHVELIETSAWHKLQQGPQADRQQFTDPICHMNNLSKGATVSTPLPKPGATPRKGCTLNYRTIVEWSAEIVWQCMVRFAPASHILSKGSTCCLLEV